MSKHGNITSFQNYLEQLPKKTDYTMLIINLHDLSSV